MASFYILTHCLKVGEQRYLKRKNGVDMVYEKSICALGVIFYQKYNVKLLFNNFIYILERLNSTGCF